MKYIIAAIVAGLSYLLLMITAGVLSSLDFNKFLLNNRGPGWYVDYEFERYIDVEELTENSKVILTKYKDHEENKSSQLTNSDFLNPIHNVLALSDDKLEALLMTFVPIYNIDFKKRGN